MTINRRRGCVVFECDACGEEFDTEERDFDEARKSAKANGWLTRLIGEDWMNYCGSLCLPEEQKRREGK